LRLWSGGALEWLEREGAFLVPGCSAEGLLGLAGVMGWGWGVILLERAWGALSVLAGAKVVEFGAWA